MDTGEFDFVKEISKENLWKLLFLAAFVSDTDQFTQIERKKGKWIYYARREPQYDIEGVKTYSIVYRCSECGFLHTVIKNFGHYKFCPQCGADMRGEQE